VARGQITEILKQKYGYNKLEKYLGFGNDATYNNMNIRAYHIDKV
jgi:hypothetical protein